MDKETLIKYASAAVSRAVKAGKLPPAHTQLCAHCHERSGEEYHHYKGHEKEHWLDVIPLCVPCHGKTRARAKSKNDAEAANIILDRSSDKNYFIQTPQIVLILCRNPYDFTLWSVIKMIAGEYGECVLATEDLAALAMMSAGKASDSRAYLLAVGLLEGSCYRDPGYPQPIWHLTIPDIWLQNVSWRQLYDSLRDRVELKQMLKALFEEADIFRRFNPRAMSQIDSLHDLKPESLHNMKPSQYEKGGTQNEGMPSHCEEGITQNEAKKNHIEPERRTKRRTRKGAGAPLPQKTEIHLAIQAYRSVASRYPDKATWQMIAETVGDKPDALDFWKEVVRNYIACGWNKINIKGMLEFFKKGILPTTEPVKNGDIDNGHKRQRSTPAAPVIPADPAQQARLRRMQASLAERVDDS